MVLVGRVTGGFPEGAAPPMAAIFTRGKARRPGLRFFHGFDQSKKALREQFCLGSRLYFS
jgi:hypothetical protein